MPRCASHDRIDERVAIGLLCLQHQVLARQEAICWTVALLQQQPRIGAQQQLLLGKACIGEKKQGWKVFNVYGNVLSCRDITKCRGM